MKAWLVQAPQPNSRFARKKTVVTFSGLNGKNKGMTGNHQAQVAKGQIPPTNCRFLSIHGELELDPSSPSCGPSHDGNATRSDGSKLSETSQRPAFKLLEGEEFGERGEAFGGNWATPSQLLGGSGWETQNCCDCCGTWKPGVKSAVSWAKQSSLFQRWRCLKESKVSSWPKLGNFPRAMSGEGTTVSALLLLSSFV